MKEELYVKKSQHQAIPLRRIGTLWSLDSIFTLLSFFLSCFLRLTCQFMISQTVNTSRAGSSKNTINLHYADFTADSDQVESRFKPKINHEKCSSTYGFFVSAFFDVLFKLGGRAVTICKNKASVRAQPRTEHIFQNKSRNLKIGRNSKIER